MAVPPVEVVGLLVGASSRTPSPEDLDQNEGNDASEESVLESSEGPRSRGRRKDEFQELEEMTVKHLTFFNGFSSQDVTPRVSFSNPTAEGIRI